MKILTAQQMQAADQFTIKNEPISSINLMERAALACVDWMLKKVDSDTKINIFCGIGNNGGDGLAIARLLHQKGFSVACFVVCFSDNFSANFLINRSRLEELKVAVKELKVIADIPEIEANSIVIDAVFGIGLSRPVTGIAENVITKINTSLAQVIAIDLPSGLFSEDNASNEEKKIIANFTLTFQSPKLALLLPENGMFVGEWHLLNIGLNEKIIAQQNSLYQLLNIENVAFLLKKRAKFSHKGTFGHTLLVGGSKGKIGAIILAAKGCLRSGAGLLSVQVPQCGNDIMQCTVPEAMVVSNDEVGFLQGNIDLKPYNTVGVGPGMGTKKETAQLLKMLIQDSTNPMVIDADALNILSENKTWLHFLPPYSILTPHPKELERLIGKTSSDVMRLKKQQELAAKFNIIVVSKGAHTAIAFPNGEVYFNSTGNAGMATGGSGDVLLGMIAGLLGQGYMPKEAAILGVYIHGLAGDMVKEQMGEEALLASDIVENIGRSFLFMRNNIY